MSSVSGSCRPVEMVRASNRVNAKVHLCRPKPDRPDQSLVEVAVFRVSNWLVSQRVAPVAVRSTNHGSGPFSRMSTNSGSPKATTRIGSSMYSYFEGCN